MAYTFSAIYLGNYGTELDPTEGSHTSENASNLNGTTYGSAGNRLHNHIGTFAPGTNGYGYESFDGYFPDNNTYNNDFTFNGGGDREVDAVVIYNATITYVDGTTATVTATVIQDEFGDLFLMPETSANADHSAFTAKPLQAITLNSVSTATAGLAADRMEHSFLEPDGTVHGTDAADTMTSGYMDDQGDFIDGSDGDNDNIEAGGGNDSVEAGAGNDRVIGGIGDDTIWGGTGNDTINGEAGADVLHGEAGRDYIYGGTGNDTIYGEGDDDIIYAGADNDLVYAGDGNDVVDGDLGDDTVGGGAGDDTISGYDGNDDLEGGLGNDLILGGDGDDDLDGDEGADVLAGGQGADTLYGDGGNDSLTGEAGDDLIYGGDGVDTIFSGDGIDYVSGGDGNDAIFTEAEGDHVDAGSGDDYVDGGAGDDDLDGDAGHDSLVGGAGEDTIYGGSGDDTISGGDGDDVIYAQSGDDSVDAGAGDDYISLNQGADTVSAGDGQDFISLSETDYADGTVVTVDGGTGGVDYDSLRLSYFSAFRNLTQTTDADGDSTSGSVEVQTPSGNWVTVNFTEIEQLYLPATEITPDYMVFGTGAGDLIDGSYTGDPEGDMVDANDAADGSNDDSIRGYGGSDTIRGGDGDDTIDGGSGIDSIEGGDGNDIVFGGSENDIIYGNAGNDDLHGGSGVDTLYGGTGDDTLRGEQGADWLQGGDGNDRLYGEDDDDTVIGGSGDDTIQGDRGDDSLVGDDGDDVFIVFDNDFGNDTVIGGESGEDNGGDQLHFGPISQDITVDLTQGSGGAANGETGIATNGADTITFSEIERIITGDGDDSVKGSDQDDWIQTRAGADTVDAGAGDDYVDFGHVSPDSDVDLFIMGDGDGNDTLHGFEGPTDNGDGTFTGHDQLDVTGLTDANGDPVNVLDVTVSDTNGDGTGTAILVFPNGESIQITGVAASAINNHAALMAMGIPGTNYIVEGTAGNDSIDGSYTGDPQGDRVDNNDNAAGNDDDSITAGAGDDTVLGGTGNDSIEAGSGDDSVLGGDGSDTILGGAGADTLQGGSGADSIDGGDDDDQIDGVSGANTLSGGDGNDEISGGGNGDLIYGDAGNDLISGNNGDDTIFGGTGSDTIYGDTGDDSIDGGDDADSIYGGDGHDTLTGGAGDDYLGGAAGNDSIAGGDGHDTLYSSDGTATLDGGAGDDRLYVVAGDASLVGGTGDDRIHGGTGSDTMLGGSGDDRFDPADDFGNDTIIGGETGETSGDTLDLSNVNDDLTIDLQSSDPEAGTVTDGTGTITFSEIENVILGGGADAVVLGDGSGADRIQGFDMTDSGDGTTVDQLDVSGMTDADGIRVNVGDVTVTDTNGDGTGDAILTFPNGESITLVGVAPSQVDSPAELRSIGIPCFTKGILIETTNGDVPVESIRPGDLVRTRDHGFQPVSWVGMRRLSPLELTKNPGLRPIVIRKGAVGNRRNMRVSPQHGVVVNLDGEARLIRAKHLVEFWGGKIARWDKKCDSTTYYHIMFDRHQIVYAEGCETESFYPGAYALSSVDLAARQEILTLFPELGRVAYGVERVETAYSTPALAYLKRRDLIQCNAQTPPLRGREHCLT